MRVFYKINLFYTKRKNTIQNILFSNKNPFFKKMNGSFESNEKKSAKGLLEKLSDVKISQSRKLTKTSTVSQTLLGNLVRKKCLEPQDQPQLLTIQNLYDADDSVTVHPINITSSNWNNRNYDINRR